MTTSVTVSQNKDRDTSQNTCLRDTCFMLCVGDSLSHNKKINTASSSRHRLSLKRERLWGYYGNSAGNPCFVTLFYSYHAKSMSPCVIRASYRDIVTNTDSVENAHEGSSSRGELGWWVFYGWMNRCNVVIINIWKNCRYSHVYFLCSFSFG